MHDAHGLILVILKFLIDFFSKKLWFPKAKPWALIAMSETLRLKSAFFCKEGVEPLDLFLQVEKSVNRFNDIQ